MVTLTSIKPNAWSRKTSKRLGRGNASGKGTFCGKGCKGQNARKGTKFSPSFEWGQSSLLIRMPKMRGFTALNQIRYTAVNIATLAKIAEETTDITKLVLISKWIIKKESDVIKILAKGEIKKAVTVEADKASAAAIEIITKAWGKINMK